MTTAQPVPRPADPLRLRGEGALRRWRAMPEWGKALTVFVAVQLVTALLLTAAGRLFATDGHQREVMGYLRFGARWDAAWYRRIAQNGYPDQLPMLADGQVVQNEWAFYPVFPMLARGLITVGLPWPWAGWLIAGSAALLAVVLLHRLVAARHGSGIALWTVALLAAFPSAAVFQVPYSESVGLCGALAVLIALQRRRLPVLLVLLPVVALARPIGVPLAVVVLAHLLRHRAEYRARYPALSGLLLPGGVLAAAAAGAVAWPVIVARATGVADGYARTMSAWRAGRPVLPLQPWWSLMERHGGALAALAALAALIAVAWWWYGHRPGGVVLDADLRVWVTAYLGYLLVFMDPSYSLARYLLLAFPPAIWLVLMLRERRWRLAAVLVSLLGQAVWIATIWASSNRVP